MEARRKNILITGATGLLGSVLKIVLERDFKVHVFDLDITDGKKVKKYSLKEKIDWIVHTAAFVNVDGAEADQHQCYQVNVEGTRNVAELAKRLGAKMIYISTVSVFSGQEGNYKENDVPYPKNFYSLTKLLGEFVVQNYENALILRLNLIGIHPEGSRGRNIIERIYNAVKNKKNIKLFSDVVMNPLSNWTVAESIKKIIEKNPKEKILHIGSKNILSQVDIGKLVIGHFKNYTGNIEVLSVDQNKGASRPKKMWLNADVAKKLGLLMPLLESEIEKIIKNYPE